MDTETKQAIADTAIAILYRLADKAHRNSGGDDRYSWSFVDGVLLCTDNATGKVKVIEYGLDYSRLN